jgi:parvulin-like peptidyl-prolyl isomerase
MIDGEAIGRDEYTAFLHRLYGRRPLWELIRLRLLEREARRLGLAVEPAEIERALEEHLANWLDERCRGDQAELERQLEEQGHDVASYGDYFRQAKRRELLASRIVLATRTVGDADVQRAFEREFGPGGVHTTLRDLFLSRQRLASELARANEPASARTPEELDRRLRAQAEELKARLAAGAGFEELVRTESEDLATRVHGGLIEDGSWTRFGDDYARAVADAPEHAVQGPIATGTGVHLFEVVERRRTRFEDHRDEIAQRLRNAPASLEEVTALDERLQKAATIRIL